MKKVGVRYSSSSSLHSETKWSLLMLMQCLHHARVKISTDSMFNRCYNDPCKWSACVRLTQTTECTFNILFSTITIFKIINYETNIYILKQAFIWGYLNSNTSCILYYSFLSKISLGTYRKNTCTITCEIFILFKIENIKMKPKWHRGDDVRGVSLCGRTWDTVTDLPEHLQVL